MPIRLTAHQRRVLGVLIEKQMTTPQQYPLTLNSLVTGCNQLTCRDPVMHMTEGEVARAVYDLQQYQLVEQAPPDRTARANRFQQNVEARFGWGTRERAVMAELLLRGPQTIGELRGNASRMTPLDDIHYVAELLGALAGRDPPCVRELPRQPGRSVVRYDHCFYPDDEPREYAAAPITEAATTPGRPAPADDLDARLKRLEADVAALRATVEELAARQRRDEPPGPSQDDRRLS